MAYVAEISARARAFCARAPLSERAAAQVELCIVEAVNNAIEHACGARPDMAVTLTVTRSAAALSIEVSDRGERMPAELLKPGAPDRLDFDPRNIEGLPERGLGLAIIKQVMDDVSYRSEEGVNTLSLVLRLPHSSLLG